MSAKPRAFQRTGQPLLLLQQASVAAHEVLEAQLSLSLGSRSLSKSGGAQTRVENHPVSVRLLSWPWRQRTIWRHTDIGARWVD